jgi:hypothetical protein
VNVTLTDYTPVLRYDGIAWSKALLYESETGFDSDPWLLIDEFTLSPIDADPKNPATRSFTSDAGTLENGWYKIVWQDEFLNESGTPAVQNIAVVRAYRPLVADVGEIIRSRTVDANATEQGTFTADTRPTYEQVDHIIDRAMWKLEAKFGPVVKQELVGAAAEVVALRAALMIELSFFGDQIRADRSPYLELKELYDEAISDYDLQRRELGTDDTPGTDDDNAGAGLPSYSFPVLTSPKYCPPWLADFTGDSWPI